MPGAQPLDRLLPEIRNRYPGTFYDAEGPYPDESGNAHYRLKWMTPEGRVIWLDTDARTGRVLGVSPNRFERYAMPPQDERAPADAIPHEASPRHFGGDGLGGGRYNGMRPGRPWLNRGFGSFGGGRWSRPGGHHGG